MFRSVLVAACAALIFSACLQGPAVPAGVIVRCTSGDHCPTDLVCLIDERASEADGTCEVPDAVCRNIDVSARQTRFATDGTTCSEGICVAGACVAPRCGDGLVGVGEGCDDGNDIDGDGCDAGCLVTACGNGVHTIGEACDDGNTVSGDGCRADCQKIEVLGDLIVDANEECDDGNDNPVDGCDGGLLQTWREALIVSGRVEGAEATVVGLELVDGIARDALGRVFVVDQFIHGVRRIDVDGTITIVAGNGQRGFSGDGGPATLASLDNPRDVDVDALGRIFIADSNNHVIRMVDVDGLIQTVAGLGRLGRIFCQDPESVPSGGLCRNTANQITGEAAAEAEGDGGSALFATVTFPSGVRVRAGEIFIGEEGGHRVRRVDARGRITTLAGTGQRGSTPDGVCRAAIEATCETTADCAPNQRCVDGNPAGGRYCGLSCGGPDDCAVDEACFSATPVLAVDAQLASPSRLAVADNGDVFVGELSGHHIRRITPEGAISTVAGSYRANAGFSGDGGPATAARVFSPAGLSVRNGALFFSDTGNHVIRRIDLVTGVIETIAGLLPTPAPTCGVDSNGYLFDGVGGTCVTPRRGYLDGDAAAAAFNVPRGLVHVDDDTVLIVDQDNRRVRRLHVAERQVDTLAGNGRFGFVSGGRPAITNPFLDKPGPMALDPDGRLIVVDVGRDVTPVPIFAAGSAIMSIVERARPLVWRIEDDGTTRHLAGSGEAADSGDEGPAIDAGLEPPRAIVVDGRGDQVLLSATGTLRRIDQDGIIHALPLPGGLRASGLTAAHGGRLVVIDDVQDRVLRVEEDGSLTQLNEAGRTGEVFPVALASSPGGGLVFSDFTLVDPDNGVFEPRLQRVAADGTRSVVALDLAAIGDFDRTLGLLTHIGVDASERVILVDADRSQLLRVEDDGSVVTIAGTGIATWSGDGGPATEASLRLRHILRPRPPTIGNVVETRPATVVGATDGSLYLSEQPAPLEIIFAPTQRPLARDAARVRRIAPDGTVTTVFGPLHPLGPGRLSGSTELYEPRALTSLPDGRLLAAGERGRLLLIDDQSVRVVLGLEAGAPSSRAELAPLLEGPHGLAFDPEALTVWITEREAGTLRTVDLDVDDDGAIDPPSDWTAAAVSLSQPVDGPALREPAGAAWDPATDTLLVADVGSHAVYRVSRDGTVTHFAGDAGGAPGSTPGFLFAPVGVVAAVDGSVFVADSGNHRVLRLSADGTTMTTVIGVVGVAASTGDGQPATGLPVNAPAQIAVDAHANLYVTSTTTVRQVTNVLDDDPENDAVRTIFGGDRGAYPASHAACLTAISVVDDHVDVADACLGFMVRLTRQP